MKRLLLVLVNILWAGQLLAQAAAQPTGVESSDCQSQLNCKSAWLATTELERQQIYAFAEDYKAFIAKARTELSFVTEAIIFAQRNGFVELEQDSSLNPGERYYEVNRDRTISLLVIGEQALEQGMHIIGAHIDSPRLDLKGRPLYDSGEFALLQTNNHGGIKYHQWTNIPLALMGRVDKKDGSSVAINIGLDIDDPIFIIAELSPHTDRGRGSKNLSDFLGPEDLDPLIGHLPQLDGEGGVADQVTQFLQQNYQISLADLVSAELSLVPAGPPRDLGFDRALIAAYGQDDRLAAYTSMRALAEVSRPQKTIMVYLVDNEEVGNRNNTGAGSEYFADLISRLLYTKMGSDYREPVLRATLRATKFISIDVNPGVNPANPGAWELGNAPRLGHGINIKLYGKGNSANSEFIAWTRQLLDSNNIPWQTSTYKVGAAGGGTIGGEFSRQNIEVIDVGVPLLSIHTPYSVSSKIDVFNLYRTSAAFFEYRD